MYDKCGAKRDALQTFAELHQRNVYSWNFIIKTCAQQGHQQEALQLLDQMQQEGVMPNKVTFASILSAYEGQPAIDEGRRMHLRIKENGFEFDIRVGTALVNMYGKCGSLEAAHTVFERMPDRNVVSWTAMIALYGQLGRSREALQFYEQMQVEGFIPDKVTFVSILAGCTGEALLDEARRIHAHILDAGFESDIVVGTALVNLYGKCLNLKEARRVFDKMPSRNVVSWTAMISIYAEHGQGKEALRYFDEMQSKGVIPNKVTFVSILAAYNSREALPKGKQLHAFIKDKGHDSDVTVGNALVNMYGKCGSVEDAWKSFVKIAKRDLISWNTMIAVYADHGFSKDAFELFDQMQQERVEPDKVTFINVLAACTSQADLVDGERLHAQICARGFEEDTSVANALVSMYGKCGNLDFAKMMFDKMSERNVISWTAMIGVFVELGQGNKALQFFAEMQQAGVESNMITFVNVLTACAHQAALLEGRQIHSWIMEMRFEPDLAVGNVLINMYGKCGRLEDACRTFEKLPNRDLVSWNAMIAVYAQHGHGKEVLQLFNQMQGQNVIPDKFTVVGVLVACSHAGLVDEGCHVFNSMKRSHGILHIVDHYICMIDLLGRAGLLEEAHTLLNRMPFQPTKASFMSLLGACRYQTDVLKGECAANYVHELDPENPASYVMLSNIYAAAHGAAKLTSSVRMRV